MTIDAKTLEELKNQLLEERTRLEEELSKFATKTDKEGDFKTKFPEDIGNEQSENAIEVEEYVDNLALEKSLESQLKDVIDALKKMEEGTYGKDEETGEDIDVARLKAYPAARTNVTKE
jgi:RNA polymerase-binding transcription factor DksA